MKKTHLAWIASLSLLASPLPAQHALAANEYGLPALGGASSAVSPADEFRLGRAWLRQFRAQTTPWRDPITRHYVERILHKLLPYSGLEREQLIVTLVASRTLNAFAVPGGVVGIHTGLFAYAPTEATFASVLAHELGHLSQHHFARQVEARNESQIPMLTALLTGVVLAASGGGGGLGAATVMGTQAAYAQRMLTYSRQYEREADDVGLDTLAQAGYDPHAMPQMFRILQNLASLQGFTPPEFLLTHPLTEARISATEARADQLGQGRGAADDTTYDMIRARVLLAMNMSDPTAARNRLKENNPSPEALRYLDAMTHAVNHETDQALSSLDRMIRDHPDDSMLQNSAADVALDANRFQDALDRARTLLTVAPDNYPARMIEGRALLNLSPAKAYPVLKRLSEAQGEDPEVWSLLSEAAGRSGREAEGHLALAEQLQLTGRIDKGLAQLDIAERQARAEQNFVLASKIRDRRDAFKRYRHALDDF
ncbi:M48 family metalloprotease [Larsenimonas suaedae]|uniref:M48 family metalloprotease n=1 Tax=Larsenimonas suaedae TaxID=1851019 RepID=A0ABU1GTZ4_9GAMM|nr:M48 family metalloprotease [Larsenimonas suaedae]MCM2971897.1 M48 family metalloprotease [Larsenimonas suaedae]MDR5895449.1 M48 family metalloprotease [Larsenimonas suaedae]